MILIQKKLHETLNVTKRAIDYGVHEVSFPVNHTYAPPVRGPKRATKNALAS